MKERVDEIAVANLFGHTKEGHQKVIQFAASLLGHHFDGASSQISPFGQTGQQMRHQWEQAAQLLVELGKLAEATAQVRLLDLLLSLDVHEVDVVFLWVVAFLVAHHSRLQSLEEDLMRFLGILSGFLLVVKHAFGTCS